MSISKSQQKKYQKQLDLFTGELEDNISNYVLEETEDLIDKEFDVVVRQMKWSRGEKHHIVTISPCGEIRFVGKNTPMNLIVQMSNIVASYLYDALEDALRTKRTG